MSHYILGPSKQARGTWSLSQAREDVEESMTAVRFFSSDPIEKVAAFYKDTLKERKPSLVQMVTPQGKMITMTVEKEDANYTTTIILMSDQKKAGTNIQIHRLREQVIYLPFSFKAAREEVCDASSPVDCFFRDRT